MRFVRTQYVRLDHIKYHIGAVRRGAPNTHIIGDLPYRSDSSEELDLRNARQLIETGADSIKLEGPKYDIIESLAKKDSDYRELIFKYGFKPKADIIYFRPSDFAPLDPGELVLDIIHRELTLSNRLTVITDRSIRQRGYT